MALLRYERAVNYIGSNDVYDCMVESSDDFEGDDILENKCAVGSLAYCIEDDKVYVKKSTGWIAVAADSEVTIQA